MKPYIMRLLYHKAAILSIKKACIAASLFVPQFSVMNSQPFPRAGFLLIPYEI